MTTPEREKFEKWIKEQGCDISMTGCNNPIYMSRDVQGCWLTWKAALSGTPSHKAEYDDEGNPLNLMAAARDAMIMLESWGATNVVINLRKFIKD